MITEQTLSDIAADRRYKAYCRKLYNGNYLWEDLYQEFLLVMFEKSSSLVNFLIEANQISAYCHGVIRTLFLAQMRINSKCPIFFKDIVPDAKDDEDNSVYMRESVISELERFLCSSNKEDVDMLVTSATTNFKGYCRDNGISFHTHRKKNAKFKEHIRSNVKWNQ